MKTLSKTSKTRIRIFLLLAFLVLDLILVSYLVPPKPKVMPEIAEISAKQMNFGQLSTYFKNLADARGGAYAYDVLREASIPVNIDLHLLGHIVGDELYKQQGVNGIKVCTNDFRNACSHSIVVALFLEKGAAAIADIAAACEQAPGGKGAYGMCFHGLGHGVLAYTNFDVVPAVALCEKTGTAQHNFIESSQCAGGVVMEIVGGGFHDKQTWALERAKYLDIKNPLAICQSNIMPPADRNMCFMYITPYLFEAVGANLGSPQPADFEKAFKICDTLAPGDVGRAVCFGGFGKEFVVLAGNRDVRAKSVENMNSAQLSKVYDWCTLAKFDQSIKDCVQSALGSLYWGGENNRAVSIRFCNVIADINHKSACFNTLISAVSSFITDNGYKKQFCKELPSEFGSQCRDQLLSGV